MNNEQQLPVREAFCANCQEITEHTVEMESMRGETVFTCLKCKRAIKYPGELTPDELMAHLDRHEEANRGQVSLENAQSALDEFLAKTDKTAKQEAQPEETE